jgi:hypothetical protein
MNENQDLEIEIQVIEDDSELLDHSIIGNN